MNIEDMFKVVKARFTDDNHSSAQAAKDVEIPQGLLFKCPRCGGVLYNDEFVNAMKVCPKCGYHARLTWQERL
ncbi:MAG TPA: acetyl-CoA carboxylase carboxyl transferase subunit beta, partial [Ruminococcaceae bacterium]|nr:acetyl-CoA carboxylase carboxyl transferase subunit beta [Oscillospiraceae bacterium]